MSFDVMMFFCDSVYEPMPESTSLEWKKKQRDWMVMWKVNPIEGISSKYDYENNKWKE